MPQEYKPHISVNSGPIVDAYTAISQRGAQKGIIERDRTTHGERVKRLLNEVNTSIEDYPIISDDSKFNGNYIEFRCLEHYESILDRFHRPSQGVHLLNTRSVKEGDEDDGVIGLLIATVFIQEGKIETFLKLVEDYLNPEKDKSNKPRNSKLIDSILDIKVATLKSFWTDNLSFPEDNEGYWWEVWLRSYSEKGDLHDIEYLKENLNIEGIHISTGSLKFPEHEVVLIHGNKNKLSESILRLNSLTEIRLAKNRADFFLDDLNIFEREDWIEEAIERIEVNNDSGPIICLLDTGVNNGHPLLAPIIKDANLDSYLNTWGVNDSYPRSGHGTPMAGLALFGDLTNVLSSNEKIEIFHDIESVKVFEKGDPNDPREYGIITEEAVSRSYLMNSNRGKVFCMAVTTTDFRDLGSPSSWSSAIDNIIFGSDENGKKLFFISGGNVEISHCNEYNDLNDLEQIHDPGQSWNAITVGAYTQKIDINLEENPDTTHLAPFNKMSPSNSTSLLWNQYWPYKPDIVMEGGNLACDLDGNVIRDKNLMLLSSGKNIRDNPIVTFGDTSGASALASKLGAELKIEYPDLRAETIRGLIIHGSSWTGEMLNHVELNSLSRTTVQKLLRSVGHGVPNLERIKYSTNNVLTLLVENELKPYRIDAKKTVKTDEIHTYKLPWPTDELLSLGELEVKMIVTLSYFIEPSPGRKYFSSKFSYQSTGLRFNVKRVDESLDDFRKRVNNQMRKSDSEYENTTSPEKWLIGAQKRTRGSVHKDIWMGTAADLATKEGICVFPVTGWWRTRKNLEKYDERIQYSLIVTIETSDEEIDIYTPVFNQITIPVEVGSS